MKILFLDIDGVLNSYRSQIVLGREHNIESLDPIALDIVRKIVKETGCIICLISEWRLHWDYMELGKKLKLPIMFETSHDDNKMRGEQVQEFLDEVKPEKYVVVDNDEVDFEYDGMPFVNVAEEDGLGYKDYLLAIEYLK